MSSDSERSSEADPYSENERLHSIWKSINETKNLAQMCKGKREEQGMASEGRTPHASFIRSHARQLQNKETKPTQNRENIAHLLKKLEEAHQQNSDLKSQIERVRNENQKQMEATRKQYEHKLKHQIKRLKTVQKENHPENREDKSESLHRQIERLNLRIKSLEFENKSKENELHKLQQINSMYQQKFTQDQTKTESDILVKQGKGEQLLELNQANRTIERLVELLKKTDALKQYSPLMEQAHNLHYLANILKRLKTNQLNFKPIDKKMCNCTHVKVSEKLLWSPTECYRILLEMKLKYDYLSEDCIEEVLFEINRIYAAKEERNLKKIKENNEHEMAKLKKKLQETYDEMLAKKQITRLKKEIRVMKSVQKTKAIPKLQNLKNKGQYEDQLKLKERQIKLLQQRIRLFETQNGFYDKSLYYEGALWIIDKILLEVEGNEGNFKQFEINFRERIDANMEPEDWFRSYKEFFQNLTEINNELVEKLFSVKETVLKKMGNNSRTFQQA